MVIIGMRPAGGIHLAGGDSHRTQGGYGKGRFLAAAAKGCAHCGQRRRCPGVGGLVGNLLVAPVVHFQNGIFHRQVLYSVAQFLVEYHAARIKVFVVHAHGQHKVHELAFGHQLAPGHFSAGLKRGSHIFKIEAGVVAGYVGERHVRVQELHGAAFVGIHGSGIVHQCHMCVAWNGAKAVGIVRGIQWQHRCRSQQCQCYMFHIFTVFMAFTISRTTAAEVVARMYSSLSGAPMLTPSTRYCIRLFTCVRAEA